MLQAKIKLDDLDMYKELLKQKASVEVGYFKDKVYEAIDKPFYANVAKPNSKTSNNPMGKPRYFGKQKAMTAEQVAIFNEFGGGHTPPRPFMRTTFTRYVKNWVRYVQDDLPVSMNVKETFKDLGKMIKGHISDTVKLWKYPRNSPRTIAIKGFDNPLVDSGNMSDDFIQVKLNGVDIGV